MYIFVIIVVFLLLVKMSRYQLLCILSVSTAVILSYELTITTVVLGLCLRLSVKDRGLAGMVASIEMEGLLNAFLTSCLNRSLSNSMRPISSSTKMPPKFCWNTGDSKILNWEIFLVAEIDSYINTIKKKMSEVISRFCFPSVYTHW